MSLGRWTSFPCSRTSLQASRVLESADVVAHGRLLLARHYAARAALDAVPVLPQTRAYIAVPALDTNALDAALAHGIGFISLEVSAPAPHVHSPHCKHAVPVLACPISAHVHSGGCNHELSGPGAVLTAAAAGDDTGVDFALALGCSTEQEDGVGTWVVAIGDMGAPILSACCPHLQNYCTGLLWAAFNGHASTVRLLLAAGADIKARDRVS